MIFECLVHKIVNFVWNFFSLIKENLFFVVLPIQCKILDANTVPMICKLHSSGIYHSLNFIRNDKFKVLSSILVTNKETILNFDHTNQIVFLGFLKLKNKLFEISYLLKFLKNRGPDSNNILKVSDNLTLGHTRLSIIDINDRSNQPMITRSKKNVIVCNGEIYNFKDLKKNYFDGFSFRTNSDTEVLIEGIEKYGFDFLDKVRGFYSFALYNYEKNKK